MINPTIVTTLLEIIGAVWVAGMVLLQVLLRVPKLAPRLSGTTSLLLSEILIFVIAVAVVMMPKPFAGVTFAIFAARLIYEAVCVFLQARQKSLAQALCALILSCLVPLYLLFTQIRMADASASLLLSLLLVEIFDSFALLGGRLFGKTLLLPAISPNKTWEGFSLGFAMVALTSLALLAFGLLSPPQAAIAIVATTIFATAGDLLASWAKRLAGRKDYPLLLPGQGGLLDIYDAWIMAAPITALILRGLLN